MTCKDCLHYGICLWTQVDAQHKKICKDFKNKAYFVEVVRCEKCKYGDVSVFSKTKDGEDIACYCNLKKVVTNVDSYCPSGRKPKST